MKKNKLLAVLIAVIGLLTIVVAAFIILLSTRVNKEYTLEAGQEVSAEVFRKYSWDKGVFSWNELPDTSTPGTKRGSITVFPFTYDVTLHVTEPPFKDTEAPRVTIQNRVESVGCSLSAEQFVQQVEDSSECTVQFATEPDTSRYGSQNVRLIVTDKAGNVTEAEAQLYIVNIKESVVSELGAVLPEAEAFLAVAGGDISYVTDINTINVMIEGTYEIKFLVDGIEAVSKLQIKDTKAPKLVLKSAETWMNKPLELSEFIDYDQTTDNSDAFEAAFAVEPDWQLLGEQQVTITATDPAGNTISEVTSLLIKKDEKAPVVTVTDIDVKVGGTVSYKKAVSYYDDIDTKEEMKLAIERTGVNLNEVGSYEVTYTVTDCSGNATSVVGKINVMEEAPKWEDEDAIHEKAQKVLDSILKEGMTDREKAKAIYKWLKNNIGYVNHSEKGNYTRGAYEGLFKKQGDCFVYAATAKELLTLAGIQNIDIVKATTNPSHYWNLVYIEDGWYHFDATPRKDKSEFFLLTDAELEAYSSTHKNTHIFDRSLYPEIK